MKIHTSSIPLPLPPCLSMTLCMCVNVREGSNNGKKANPITLYVYHFFTNSNWCLLLLPPNSSSILEPHLVCFLGATCPPCSSFLDLVWAFSFSFRCRLKKNKKYKAKKYKVIVVIWKGYDCYSHSQKELGMVFVLIFAVSGTWVVGEHRWWAFYLGWILDLGIINF